MIRKRFSRFTQCALLAALGMAPQAFATGLTFTCNGDINTLADANGYTANGGNLCGTIQSTLGTAYSSAFMDANANIYIEFTSDTGLGASTPGSPNLVSYSTYYNALTLHSSGDTVDTNALASLSSSEASVFSGTNGNIELTSALAQALNIHNTDGNTNYVTGTTAPTTSMSINSGNPSAPITSSAGRHVPAAKRSAGVSPISCNSSRRGNTPATSGPSSSATCVISASRCAGMATFSSERAITPVRSSSMRDNSSRQIRNDDGTMPPACPLCTPSVSTSTRKVPQSTPRSDVVTHKRS